MAAPCSWTRWVNCRPACRPKLLRALQERSFFRLGAEKVTRSDFRIIAATNRDLHADMSCSATFREEIVLSAGRHSHRACHPCESGRKTSAG